MTLAHFVLFCVGIYVIKRVGLITFRSGEILTAAAEHYVVRNTRRAEPTCHNKTLKSEIATSPIPQHPNKSCQDKNYKLRKHKKCPHFPKYASNSPDLVRDYTKLII